MRTTRKDCNVKMRKVHDSIIALVIVIIILIVVCVLFRSKISEPVVFLDSTENLKHQRRILLLYHTDYKALLKAGREILRQGPKDTMNYRYYGIIYLGGFPVPGGIHIPKIIRDLKTYDTRINFASYLFLEMQGGVTGFGVRIYPEDFKAPARYFNYGNRKLLPGLWYYDYQYNNDPEYDKKIDQIIIEGKSSKLE
jgi:hypothetical protein